MNNTGKGSEKPSTGMLHLSLCTSLRLSSSVPSSLHHQQFPHSTPRPGKLILPYPAVFPLSVRQDVAAKGLQLAETREGLLRAPWKHPQRTLSQPRHLLCCPLEHRC